MKDKYSTSRLVVVENVYHQKDGGAPSLVENGYKQLLESEDDPCGPRQIKVGIEWTPLDLGWIEDCGLLLLKNDEGKFFVIPTEEEKAKVDALVIEISLGAIIPFSMLKLPPGRSLRLTPTSSKKIMVCSPNGIAKMTVTAYPR